MSGTLNHFLAFFTLFILLERSYPNLTCKNRIFILITYAFFIEIVQYFLPTRAAEFYDILIDSLAVLVAYFILPYLRKLKIFSFLL
ncbi:MAG: VanZ family protein [Campylobacterota bacterium]|nr:VanZ family protein [Campylobacterota bacterium]